VFELEPVWDFQIAVEKQWIPKNWSRTSVMGMGISSACGGGIEGYSSAQNVSSPAHLSMFLFLSMFLSLYAIYLVCSCRCKRHGQRHKYDEIPCSRTETKAGAVMEGIDLGVSWK
jgi:hypothetical protein